MFVGCTTVTLGGNRDCYNKMNMKDIVKPDIYSTYYHRILLVVSTTAKIATVHLNVHFFKKYKNKKFKIKFENSNIIIHLLLF